VTIKYKQNADGSVEPLMIHTVVISTQHAEPLKAKRTEEQNGKDTRKAYKGKEQIAPSMEEMNELIHDKVVVATLESITLKNGKSALSIYDRTTCNLHINPSGKFIIGGPQGDAGLTGRKIIIDTYGGWGAHGGGAFSGKDPTKVDRSAAYYCRWIAKSLVAAKLCKRCLVQLSYAIGVAAPLSIFVDSHGSACDGRTDAQLLAIIEKNFDCRAGMLVRELDMLKPKYKKTACYGHFGNSARPADPDFTWEVPKALTLE
jgi:S-adenosylmethionine synthetase